jgi:hypothetical protein
LIISIKASLVPAAAKKLSTQKSKSGASSREKKCAHKKARLVPAAAIKIVHKKLQLIKGKSGVYFNAFIMNI